MRDRHPGASKKQVVRAAFYALTGGMDDAAKAKQLHDFAIEERRTAAAPDAPARSKSSKRRKAKAEEA